MDDELDDLEYWPFLPRWCRIPELFHSLEKEGPFLRCTGCDADLQDSSRRYVIERIFRGKEPIVEYAMCTECQDGICEELSVESMERVQAMFREVNHDGRLERLRSQLDSDRVDEWIGECILTGKPLSDCHGYQIIALCQGNRIELGAAPLMISDEGIEQIMQVLSKKTRDRLDDFLGDTFGMPPEFCQQPDFFPVIV